MGYNELIRNFSGVRNYMRQFLVYGFRHRDEFDAKSVRSYDNQKRRVESWLSNYMSFRQDTSGKSVFLSVDSRHIPTNPLHKAWKASGFTKNDISIHFLLLDILADKKAWGILDILDCIDTDYLPAFQKAMPIDESTLRKKLKEYTRLGLIVTEKQGKQLLYRLPEEKINLTAWQNALSFFSEENSLGVIGSFLIDKLDTTSTIFSFKHRYLLFSLDSEIMLDLLTAINEHCTVELKLAEEKKNQRHPQILLPLKIYVSVQGGRQYLVAYDMGGKKICFFRMDSIQKIKLLEAVENFSLYQSFLKEKSSYIWGVSTGGKKIEHLEMTLIVEPKDIHIIHRLEREKRCGTVVQLDEKTWQFSANVYDTWELLPWLRTFIGRISSLTCSNPKVQQQFWSDLSILIHQYKGAEKDVVQ